MLRFGLVGYGTHARWAVHKAINENSKHGRIVAVAEILPENLAQVDDPQIARYDNHREMLAKEELDAVYVATGPGAHADPTIDALASGRHVICEKPMAENVADCQRMLAAATQSGRLLAIDFENRLMPHHRQVRAWISEGRLGRVRAIHWQQMWDGHKAFGPVAARRARLINASGTLELRRSSHRTRSATLLDGPSPLSSSRSTHSPPRRNMCTWRSHWVNGAGMVLMKLPVVIPA